MSDRKKTDWYLVVAILYLVVEIITVSLFITVFLVTYFRWDEITASLGFTS